MSTYWSPPPTHSLLIYCVYSKRCRNLEHHPPIHSSWVYCTFQYMLLWGSGRAAWQVYYKTHHTQRQQHHNYQTSSWTIKMYIPVFYFWTHNRINYTVFRTAGGSRVVCFLRLRKRHTKISRDNERHWHKRCYHNSTHRSCKLALLQANTFSLEQRATITTTRL